MNVSLTPELEGIVRRFIESGLYGNQSEVVRAALRLLHQQDQEREVRLQALRADVQSGLGQVRDGQTSSLTSETIKARGRSRMKGQG